MWPFKNIKSHKRKTAKWIKGGKGIEIGAFKTPIEGIKPYYVDKFHEFAGEQCLADVYSDPVHLPFYSSSLDYVAASHVLEHIANPVAAICEWYRVLRHRGIMYMVVPDRRYTWDRYRKLTSCEHMLDDYLKGVTDSDATHIDDFVDNVDWSEFDPSTPAEEVPHKKKERKKVYHRTVSAGEIINIHFHVYEPVNVIDLFRRMTVYPQTSLKLTILDCEERFPASSPNGFLIVVQVNKTFKD